MYTIQNPFAYFNSPTNSKPIGLGHIYIGLKNTDPTLPENQIDVFAVQPCGCEDPYLQIQQPIQLLAGGIPSYNGAPIQIVTGEVEYSISVKYANGNHAYYTPLVTGNIDVAGDLSYVNGIKNLTAISNATLNVVGFYENTTIGGGQFIYDATRSVADHNGGTVIAASAIAAWDGTQADIATLLSWAGTGVGCFIRVKNYALAIDEVNPVQFGAVEGANDNTLQIQKAVDYCGVSGIRHLRFDAGTWKSSKINKSFKNLKIFGGGGGRPGASNDGGTRLSFIGLSGAFIENGTDNGQPWDANLYDGPQGLAIDGINLHNGSVNKTAPLNSTGSTYGAGMFAVRDWRGGHIEFNNVFVEGFEYSFWCVQSDFNRFTNVTQAYTKYGIYLGPRSDQSRFEGFYSFLSDTILVVDSSSNHKINDCQIVLSGSASDHTVIIHKNSQNIVFEQPWLENFSGVVNCLPFIDVGSLDGYGGNTSAVLDVEVRSPYVAVKPEGQNGQNGIISVTKGERIRISEVVGSRGTTQASNAAYYFLIPTGVTGAGLDLIYSGAPTSKVLRNLGTGYPNLCTAASSSQWDLGSSTGRLAIKDSNGAAGADEILISQEGVEGMVMLQTPGYALGQTIRMKLRRTLTDNGARPATGTWEVGDRVRNTSPSELGTSGSKYVITEWIRITTGSDNVLNTDWLEGRVLTGN